MGYSYSSEGMIYFMAECLQSYLRICLFRPSCIIILNCRKSSAELVLSNSTCAGFDVIYSSTLYNRLAASLCALISESVRNPFISYGIFFFFFMFWDVRYDAQNHHHWLQLSHRLSYNPACPHVKRRASISLKSNHIQCCGRAGYRLCTIHWKAY